MRFILTGILLLAAGCYTEPPSLSRAEFVESFAVHECSQAADCGCIDWLDYDACTADTEAFLWDAPYYNRFDGFVCIVSMQEAGQSCADICDGVVPYECEDLI